MSLHYRKRIKGRELWTNLRWQRVAKECDLVEPHAQLLRKQVDPRPYLRLTYQWARCGADNDGASFLVLSPRDPSEGKGKKGVRSNRVRPWREQL